MDPLALHLNITEFIYGFSRGGGEGEMFNRCCITPHLSLKLKIPGRHGATPRSGWTSRVGSAVHGVSFGIG